jgi:hypothetical protein
MVADAGVGVNGTDVKPLDAPTVKRVDCRILTLTASSMCQDRVYVEFQQASADWLCFSNYLSCEVAIMH